MLDINPNVKVNAHRMFYLPENADEVDLSVYSYVIDAVDTVTAKLELCEERTKRSPDNQLNGSGQQAGPHKV